MKTYQTTWAENPFSYRDLMTPNQLQEHGESLASYHKLSKTRTGSRLLARLNQNETLLRQAFDLVQDAGLSEHALSSAGEWLLDNYYLIEENIRIARKDFPRNYSRELPCVTNGQFPDTPRVYDLVLEYISHVDGKVDETSLQRFIQGYQKREELRIGELWAVPIMLRLAIIENLRRVASRVATAYVDRNNASIWVSRFLNMPNENRRQAANLVFDLSQSAPTLTSAFVTEFHRRSQSHSHHLWLSLPISWIEERLHEKKSSIEECIQQESQTQSSEQVAFSNSIGSLRALSTTDWKVFVEAVSLVEAELRQDFVYSKMDFSTRDLYRHKVENLSRRYNISEVQLAKHLIEYTGRQSKQHPIESRCTHVGYYLIDNGLSGFLKAASLKSRTAELLTTNLKRHSLSLYVLALTLLTAVFAAIFSDFFTAFSWPWLAVTLVAIVSSQSALSIVNLLVSRWKKPVALPRLDYSHSIPESARTLVVIPTMLTSKEGIFALLEDLEIRYIGNRDANLQFALLTDFSDALSKETPEDAVYLELACQGIDRLNEKYDPVLHARFYLLHREREWNAKEEIWMGEERKRGKLESLARLLQSQSVNSFSKTVGQLSALSHVRYVITLDTDTGLPPGAAHKMISTLDHPLNRPVLAQKQNRVSEGYGILQPRVSTSLPSDYDTWFSRIYSSDAGIDPYTTHVSNLYHDLFSEGSFIGKGIYDLESFSKSVDSRFPKNRILSHDLIEGCYARCGYVSDVELFEEFPQKYYTDVSRRHRWIRGDWQIASWLFPFVPEKNKRNELSALSRWKLFDNLRRSLVPVASLALVIASTFVSAQAISVAIFLVVLPYLISATDGIYSKAKQATNTHSPMFVINNTAKTLMQGFLTIAFLPFEALQAVDAIVRTMYRLSVSKKHLLQWTSYQTSKSSSPQVFLQFLQLFWVGPALGSLLLAFYWGLGLHFSISLIVVVACWFVSPCFAWWLSQPIVDKAAELTEFDQRFVMRVLQKTWWFYLGFETKQDNYLPPDNIQEVPDFRVAHRTSPTNIGISALSSLAAYDLGFLSVGALFEREKKRFETIAKLERFHGHFLNWYDTENLQALFPKYISTVDSGNFIGFLLTLQQGLKEVVKAPIISAKFNEALLAGFDALQESLVEREQLPSETVERIRKFVNELSNPVDNGMQLTLKQVYDNMLRVKSFLNDLSHHTCVNSTVAYLMLRTQCDLWLHDLLTLTPWVRFYETNAHDDFKTLDKVFLDELNTVPSLEKIVSYKGIVNRLKPELTDAIHDAVERAEVHFNTLQLLSTAIDDFCTADFNFLYSDKSRLFSIGYNVSDHRMDAGNYDLLASEARLASYVAIAQGQVPVEHWFALGRQATRIGSARSLISWSGSMFEYLMPNLIMPFFERTLLGSSLIGAVKAQIIFAKQKGVPWGISESAYNLTDSHFNYQYRAFGVPNLGLKRGLEDDLVIAPYATMMSLLVCPKESMRNLERMTQAGFEGQYGYYEAIDYTRSRNNNSQPYTLMRSFMAHHQGMAMLAAAERLCQFKMQQRFMNRLEFKTFESLLQERVPETRVQFPPSFRQKRNPRSEESIQVGLRRFDNPTQMDPHAAVLSNGRYRVLVTTLGASHSSAENVSLTPWRPGIVTLSDGLVCFVRELNTKKVWSPTLLSMHAEQHAVTFTESQVEFFAEEDGLQCTTTIVVSSEDNVELRKLNFTNTTSEPKVFELTTFAEIALCPNDDFLAHPAFSKLFIETQLSAADHAILCSRRPRSETDERHFMFHMITPEHVDGHSKFSVSQYSFETDRSRFLGRSRPLPDAIAFENQLLSNTSGAVLDGCVAIRCQIEIPAGSAATLNVYLGHSRSDQEARHLIEKYSDSSLAKRVCELAWVQAHVFNDQLSIFDRDYTLIGSMLDSLVFPNPLLRSGYQNKIRNRLNQSQLWSMRLSGDLPIVLVRITSEPKNTFIQQLLKIHAYLRHKKTPFDLVFMTEEMTGYRNEFADSIRAMLQISSEASLVDKNGGIHILLSSQVNNEQKLLLHTCASVILNDFETSLENQLDVVEKAPIRLLKKNCVPVKIKRQPELPALELFNGIGGFSKKNSEYSMNIRQKSLPPRPWCNVIANPWIGMVVSERGAAYSWYNNAQEFRLSPWFNDAIRDDTGELLYIKDDQTQELWSPLPLWLNSGQAYAVSHGQGYSRFETNSAEIGSRTTFFTAFDAPVLFCRIELENLSDRTRRLSLTRFMRLVLGSQSAKTAAHIVVKQDSQTGALFANNPFHVDFNEWHVFAHATGDEVSFTTNRRRFFGNGSEEFPDALAELKLPNDFDAVDACLALQSKVELEPLGTREVVFVLGATQNRHDLKSLLQRYTSPASAHKAFQSNRTEWDKLTKQILFRTPVQSLNFLANGWLAYQVVACRMWARSGFYQSGGAYGYRDQLQDAMALVHCFPRLLRDQISRAATKQFVQGDVMHWWHPQTGRGVRTHFSDDLLWLPLAVTRYIQATGEYVFLEQHFSYIEGPQLNPEEESRYLHPSPSVLEEPLYEHCKKAIILALKTGAHGLPLMGCGDWNDGMNKIGEHGKGESVWLAFFLGHVLTQFKSLAQYKNDLEFVTLCETHFQNLGIAANQSAWDGQWFMRAFFDDGTPVGSKTSSECKIDSLPQSWSVLSGMTDPERASTAMQSAADYLIDENDRFMKLFTPPFFNSEPNPGYIKGYVPGVRENGGQYTHATIWYLMALCEMGRVDDSFALFDFVNPVNHTSTAKLVQKYGAEPYVVSADIYSNPAHNGRGGWSWYTGSAAWAYRYITESLFGLKLVEGRLHIVPKLPETLIPSEVTYRFETSQYDIHYIRGSAEKNIVCDGKTLAVGEAIELKNDGLRHKVIVSCVTAEPTYNQSHAESR